LTNNSRQQLGFRAFFISKLNFLPASKITGYLSTAAAAEENWRIKKLENLVQIRSIGSIVCARPTAAPRNGRRDNAVRIMTT